jgi:hypothetical protein
VSVADNRVPFEEAINESLLLKDAFDVLSFPQATTLKAFYGLTLNPRLINPTTGWNELDYWAIIQGSCTYDELGYVQTIQSIPYSRKEYDQLWAVYGRRSGKTDKLMAFILAYEACLGGHQAYVSQGQDCLVYMVAHRMDIAKANMPSIRAVLDSSPLLSKEVIAHTAESLRLKNNINIVPSPPSLKAQRGIAVPAVGFDEVAFWYSDADAANPDFEVERAVAYSQLQFPHSKRAGVTTPWTKEGLAYKYNRAGTDGQKLPQTESKEEYEGILSCFAPTAALENPRITRKKLTQLFAKDADAFKRESLCMFPDSISSFFSQGLLESLIEKGAVERAPMLDGPSVPHYVAAMDPAFRYDSFALVIGHRDMKRGIVVDVTRRWTPLSGVKLNPKEVLAEVVPLLKSYGVTRVSSDQYQLESLQQIALDMGLSIEGTDFTARSKVKIFGNLSQLVNQRKLVLLDGAFSESNAALVSELITLEKRIGSAGNIQISAPVGKHDDMASALALMAFQAVWLTPTEDAAAEPEETLFERGMSSIRRHRMDTEQSSVNFNFQNWD